MTLWDQIERRTIETIVSGRRVEHRPIYGRICDHCGHLELGTNPLLVHSWRECPSCTVRGAGDHGRT